MQVSGSKGKDGTASLMLQSGGEKRVLDLWCQRASDYKQEEERGGRGDAGGPPQRHALWGLPSGEEVVTPPGVGHALALTGTALQSPGKKVTEQTHNPGIKSLNHKRKKKVLF